MDLYAGCVYIKSLTILCIIVNIIVCSVVLHYHETMGDESKKSGLRSTIRRGLFYGRDDDDNSSSDNGDVSGASDDSVDDPSVMLEHLSDVEEQEQETVQSESDAGDVIESDVNVGASTSASASGDAPRGGCRRVRVQGRERERDCC